jgi:predicted AlkP superfamily phosphohydrolase/phosphomutase
LAKAADRIIVIGLDSVDVDLVQRWSAEGRLPFLSSLMQAGAWARLISTRGLFSDSPWPSFNTGVSPAKHAFYNYLQLKRGTTEIIRADARHCRYYPFWWLLRAARKKVAVFDVPKTYPLDGVEGLQIAAWGEHYPLLRQSSLPSPLAQELTARFGRYRHPREIVEPRLSQETRIRDRLSANIRIKAEATEWLMHLEDWDLFIAVFGEAHYGGHQFFHHFSEKHWAYDSKYAALFADVLPKIYSDLDASLAHLLRGSIEEATIFIVSVHGIATNYSANHLMPAVLEKLGFQVRPVERAGPAGWRDKRVLLRALEGLIPASVKKLLREGIVPQSMVDKVFARHFSDSIDWHATQAFFLPSDDFQGFISVNLKGREPWGTVEPGSECRELCNRICFELRQLVNPKTGRAAVRDAVQVSELYQGENLYRLPDIVIQWAEVGPIDQLYHSKFGIIADESFAVRRNQHSADGFLIAAGKRINKRAELSGASTMDLAPTLLYLMGETVPKEMDGRVLSELIDEEFKKSHPINYGERPLAAPEESAF